MAEKEKIIIREATLSDKDAVMKIRDNVYGGRDYLLSYYDKFVTSDNCYSYVAAINGEIIAFGTAYLVDNMTTVVNRAGRINPKYAGKNIKQMYSALVEKLSDLGVQQELSTSHAANLAMYKDSFKIKNRLILEKDGFCYLVDGRKWHSKTNDDLRERFDGQIQEATDSDLTRYISTQSYRDYLFPDGVIVIDWVPYKPLQSNLKLIRNHDNRLILTDVFEEKGKIKGMVSIASLYQCSHHFYGCHYDIYGRDTSTFKKHLLRSIDFLTSITKDPISLVIFVDPQMNKGELKNVVDSLGLEEYQWIENGMPMNKLYLFQSKL